LKNFHFHFFACFFLFFSFTSCISCVSPNIFSSSSVSKLLPLYFVKVDYDEVFAKDLVHYIRTMYTAMDKQGHLQVLRYRTNIESLNQLDAIKQTNTSTSGSNMATTMTTPMMKAGEKKEEEAVQRRDDDSGGVIEEGKEGGSTPLTSSSQSRPPQLDSDRAKELYEQVVRHRVLEIETMMLERAYPYLPACDGSLSSRITFMQAIQSKFSI
jgi:hypothetical protein